MKNIRLLIRLFLPFFCLLVWTCSIALQRNGGTEVKLPIRGYDPRDLFSGHYLVYEIDWKNADCSQFPSHQCPPEETFGVKARWGQENRFYLPEKEALKIEELFRQSNRSRNFRSGAPTLRRNASQEKPPAPPPPTFEVLYSYKAGQPPYAKELLLDGQPWKEYLQQHPVPDVPDPFHKAF